MFDSIYCPALSYVPARTPSFWFFSLHCSRLWVNGGIELHSEAGWIVNDLKRCHMQSTIWPPGGRHSILKCSIFTHYRCFFLKSDKNSCVKTQTRFLLKLVVIGIYFGVFMQTLHSYSSKIYFVCVRLMLSYISPTSVTIKHVMSRATQIKL